jgi:uncharacterized protein YodC (DUF2158 family)
MKNSSTQTPLASKPKSPDAHSAYTAKEPAQTFGNTQTEQAATLVRENHLPSEEKAGVPPQQATVESTTLEHAPTKGETTGKCDANTRARPSESVQDDKKRSYGANTKRDKEPRYSLYRRDDGKFWWQDNINPAIEGMLFSDKGLAERLLDVMNDDHRQQMLPPKEAVGELVQLKSGGPAMTIVKALGNGSVLCKWFRGNKLQKEALPMDALQTPQPEKRLRRAAKKIASKRPLKA